MDDRDLRLECLKIAAANPYLSKCEDIVSAAKKMMNFVEGSPAL